MQTNETQTELQQLALDLVRTQKQLASSKSMLETLLNAVLELANSRDTEIKTIQDAVDFLKVVQDECVPVANFEGVGDE